ncbi:MAG: RNA 2',3'-cyclic phosphodiesterase [Nitrospinaceae bacterium]
MDALRLFLAIDIPDFAREKIAEVQNDFKMLNLDAAWVNPAKIHLTMKFLGNTLPRLIPEIKERMVKITLPVRRFHVCLDQVGVFPNLNRPRVLWVGLQDPQGQLIELRKKIEDEMAGLDFHRETKAGIPHLTLARIKSGRNRSRLKQEVESGRKISAEPIEVRSVHLIQSRLTREGPVYTVLDQFPLSGTGDGQS